MLRTGILIACLALLTPGPARAEPPPRWKWSKDAIRWAPALLQVLDRHRERRPVRLRIYAEQDYAITAPHWQVRARGMIDDLNVLVGPTFGVRFEVESFRRWEGAPRGSSTSKALDLLATKDPGEDVDWVVGFMAPLQLLSSSMHEIGMARELGRHFVLRAMAELEEAEALKPLDAVSGAMTQVLQTESVRVEVPISEIMAMAPAISPVAGAPTGWYAVLTVPGADRFGDHAGSVAALQAPLAFSGSVFKIESNYGDPYPRAWGRINSLWVDYTVPVLVPGAAAPVNLGARIFTRDTAPKLATGTVRLLLSPVQDPQINGKSAFVETIGATATPLISWSPPAQGEPDVYFVELLQARVTDGKASISTIAWLHTQDTSIRLPPDLLQFGESYVMRIYARMGEGLRVTRPWMQPAKLSHSACVTARFTP